MEKSAGLNMIENLTQEQENRFPEFVDKWTKIGLSTEPANRKLAEEGIIEMYNIAGLEKPKIVWCASPFANGITRKIVQKIESDGLLKNGIKKIGASVRASVRDSVWDSVWASLEAFAGDSGYGQHDANWLALYDFFKEVCGLKKETEKLSGLWKVSQNAGWYLPHENICWISERHNILHINASGKLHSEREMAVAYPDGWGTYALDGVRFQRELWEKIVNKTLSSNEAIKLTNVEQRIIAMKYLGGEKALKELGGEMFSKDEYGELWRLKEKDAVGEPYVYFIDTDPSKNEKVYLRIYPECKTPQEAMAQAYKLQLFGIEYKPSVRT